MTRNELMAHLHNAIKPGRKSVAIAEYDTYPYDFGYYRALLYYTTSREYLQKELSSGGGLVHLGDLAIARVLMVCFEHFRNKGDLPAHIEFPHTLLLSQEQKQAALHKFADEVEKLR